MEIDNEIVTAARRERLAAAALSCLVVRDYQTGVVFSAEEIAADAVAIADAIIAELDR